MDNNTNNNVVPAPMADANDVEQNKIYAILAYLGILFIIPLFAAKDSKFAKFHANQGAIVFIMTVIITMVYVFSMIIRVGLITCCVSFLYFIPMVFSILGIINALNGKMERLPVIGNMDLIK